MARFPQDRLVRKEVALGVIREYEPPQEHIGTRLFAPMKDVESDDVIFDYTRGLATGLAPARSEDSEAEMAGKDDSVGTGRASVIDWALKDHYDPSDVSRYRDNLILGGLVGAASLSLLTTGIKESFETRLARDAKLRRLKLDNRIEWLITQGMDLGHIAYNDGKIVFSVDYGRPGDQQDMAPPSGHLWDTALADPIGDIQAIQQDAFDTYGVRITRCVVSNKVVRNLYKATKFVDLVTGADPMYRVTGWGPKVALDFIGNQTGMQFINYDSVYRTRALGSNTMVNNKFIREKSVIFLPSAEDVAAIDDAVGFGATLTSPHVEGGWTPGYYEWEKELGPDPWGHDFGTGIKAFPVFPHMDLTYVMAALA